MHIWNIKKPGSSTLALIAVGAVCSPAIAGVAENSAALSSSIAWLEQQQNQDGSWGQDPALRYSVTTTVADLLPSSNKYSDAYYASISWIENHSADNVDALSRKIDVLFERGNNVVPDLIQLNNSKPDAFQAGWGLSSIYTSSSIDSVLALTAMLKAGDTIGQNSAVSYLLTSQLGDGGWSVVNAGVSDYWITANVVSGLSDIGNPSTDVIAALTNAVTYLQSAPVSSDSLVLASVAQALYAQQGLTPLVDSHITELLSRQSPAGDWGDIYTTATSSRLLAAALQLDTGTLGNRVSMEDQTLREIVNQFLGKNPYDNLTQGELLQVSSLDLRGTNVSSLAGLEYATNLQALYIDSGVDINAIAGINGLTLTVNESGILKTYVNYTLDSNKLVTTETLTETVDYSLVTTGLPTAAGIWQPAEVLNNNAVVWDAWGAQLALDDNGNGTVLWREYGDNYDNDPYAYDVDKSSTIYSRRYDATLGWQAPVVVGTGYTDEATWGGKLLMDKQGNGFALWRVIDPVTYIQTAYIARFDAISGWQTPMVLSAGNGSAGAAHMAMDDSGNVIAMLTEYDSSTQSSNTYARRFDVGLGWEQPYTLGTGNIDSDTLPNIAMDSQGNAIAVWYEYDSSTAQYTSYARRYDNSLGWQSNTVLGVDVGFRGLGVAFDDQGNGHVIRHSLNTSYTLYEHRFDGLLGWGVPELLINTTSDISNLNYTNFFTANGQDKAMLMWSIYDSVTAKSTAYARRYEESTGWQPTEVVAIARAATIVLDDAGYAQAIWWDYDYDTHLYTTYAGRYDAVLGWQSPVVIQEDNYGIWNVDLKINAEGDAMILGRGDAGGMSLVAQRYLAGDAFYLIQSGDTWVSIASALYASADVSDELQAALGNPTLIAGNMLQNLPSVLSSTSTTTITVPPYYLVLATDTWATISASLYGTTEVADELQTALGTSVLITGDKLTGIPGNLFDLVSTQ